MTSDWPEYEIERVAGILLRVELQEQRHRETGAWAALVDHLNRAVSAACLISQEEEAEAYVLRTSEAMRQWVAAVRQGYARASYNNDFSSVRGMLTLVLSGVPEVESVCDEFLRQTGGLPIGPVYNARLVAQLVLRKEAGELARTGMQCSMEDQGLGAPWRRFALAIPAGDLPAMRSSVDRWLLEKTEATQTHEWGAYNEVPIEVSGALAVAERWGTPLKVSSNRVLPRFRTE